MNIITITGRLTAAPEMRTTNSGKSVCNFTLAVDYFVGGEKKADFIRCTAWDKQADVIEKYCDRGDKIGVNGSLHIDKYKDKNGVDKEKSYIRVSSVELLGGKAPARDPENGQIHDEDFPL